MKVFFDDSEFDAQFVRTVGKTAVVDGTRRGYAVLMVDRPGQGSALYEQGLVIRPDYEAVFGAILDFAGKRPEVDRQRLALSGRSFGGYLAPRAACFESRARALIADPGLDDLGAQVRSQMPPELWSQVEASAPDADRTFAQMFEQDPHREYYFKSRAVTHGAKGAPEYLRMLQAYQVPAVQITVPALVTAQPGDAETRRLYDAISAPKMLAEFDPDAGEWGHNEAVALSRYDQVVHDWLDGVLVS
jgi:hypothetical protein